PPAGIDGRRAAIVARPWLKGITSLDLSHNSLSAAEWRALMESPHLGRLSKLTLRNVALTPEGMERLAAWPGLRRLTAIDLGNDYRMEDQETRYNQLGLGWLNGLLGSPHLGQLTSLDLSGLGLNNVPDQGADLIG